MKNNFIKIKNFNIKDKIHSIRGLYVMLDSDLAEIYEVETKALKRTVKRNIERFPDNFMFELSKKEAQNLRYQNDTSRLHGGRRYMPYVFSEQGVAMLAGLLKSNIAINVSIQIINTFVAMRHFMSSKRHIFNKLGNIEKKHIEYDQKFDKIFKAIERNNIKPDQGIFFEGQIFDAYKFVSNLIKAANKSIILIDNYIDKSVLTILSNRKKRVRAKILTKKIPDQLKLDLEKNNKQHPEIKIEKFTKSHDRFLIIDEKEIYHFGASFKDLGRKCFAFTKFNNDLVEIFREKFDIK
jgi:ribosomal protein S17E